MKVNFSTMPSEVFANYEDRAIDGCLIYDDFPAIEYKYFSRLARLGYHNRHDGWSRELCEEKQQELCHEYKRERERAERFGRVAQKMQNNIRRGGTLISDVVKTKNSQKKLTLALQALELLRCEDGFAKINGAEPPPSTQCDTCAGVVEWDDDELGRFYYCPKCGREL